MKSSLLPPTGRCCTLQLTITKTSYPLHLQTPQMHKAPWDRPFAVWEGFCAPPVCVNGFTITQARLLMYLHITLVCVDPVEERLRSHPFHRETTLRTQTDERVKSNPDKTHWRMVPKVSWLNFNHGWRIPLQREKADMFIRNGGMRHERSVSRGAFTL